MFIKFEELKVHPAAVVKRLAEFLGFPFSLEEERDGVIDEVLDLCSFKQLSNLDVNKNGKAITGHKFHWFFRRGEVGDWVNHLTPEMAKRIDQVSEANFRGTGLNF